MVDVKAQDSLGDSPTTDLFQILRDGRARTRSELASITGLARSTVAARVDSLVKLGLVSPVGDAVSTGGRPSSQFAINSSGRVVLGVDIGASHARIAIADLSGALLGQDSVAMEVAEGPEAVLGWVTAAATELLATHGAADGLLAIGVGLPGPVEHSSGLPIDPPIMPGWDRYDVPEHLGRRFGVPVLVDNDVNIMALGERDMSWPGVDHFIFVKVATGIGSGVISGGYLQRGAQGIAGDIGHVYVPSGKDVVCRCGNFGCLEAIAAGPAIARQLRESGLDVETSADVAALVKAGNTTAIQAVRAAGRLIGEVLTTCVSLINPAVIVLGGSIAHAGEHLLAGAREVIYMRSMPLATGNLQIAQSRSGANAAIQGASMLAIHHALSPERVDAMLGGR
ncbi:ROK family transcriptional regulator [Demequina muriae]|uniref:ROK family transcriptional regulator n=1 Tax=Demequina muriae TaxID=3051664 RepID=A0ABT8GI46_9MICO|nr:ROK family transcriptional regulator [Demequina sp. EGI L300058]MDN4481107.1 ROK family transcriptional regulator [Demequina sp. EGI L300058]